jgi:hypothetical protein
VTLFGSKLATAVVLHYGVETTFRFKQSLSLRVGLGALWIFAVACAALAVYTEGKQHVLMDPNSCAAAEVKRNPPVDEIDAVIRPNANMLAMRWNSDGTFPNNDAAEERRGLRLIGASRLESRDHLRFSLALAMLTTWCRRWSGYPFSDRKRTSNRDTCMAHRPARQCRDTPPPGSSIRIHPCLPLAYASR